MPPCMPVLLLREVTAHDSQAPGRTSSHRSLIREGAIVTALVTFLVVGIKYLTKNCLREEFILP